MDIPHRGNIDQDYFSVIADLKRLPMLESFVGDGPRAGSDWRWASISGGTCRAPATALGVLPPIAPSRSRRAGRGDRDSERDARAEARALHNACTVASPFGFPPGSAAMMTADLPSTPVTGLMVVACGDMHVANFGVHASAERQLVFAINDFGEVYPGPWEWDL